MNKAAVLRLVQFFSPDLMRLALGAACSIIFLVWIGKINLPPLSISWWETFQAGGFYMWIITAIFIIGLGFLIERFSYFKSLYRNDMGIETIVAAIKQWGWKKAGERLESHQGPVIKLFRTCLANKDAMDVDSALDNVAEIEVSLMERHVPWITLCIAAAPMLGFLGTVSGMIESFKNIKLANDISPAIVAGGISVALITTAFGLIVAVVLLILQNVVLYIIDNQTLTLQQSTTQLLDEIKSNH